MMKIGQIETDGTPGRRDAFHVPAVLVTCDNQVTAGQPVRFIDDTFTKVDVWQAAIRQNKHGIVDPFVSGPILPGLMFWVLLMPGMIKDRLTHQFELNISDVPHKMTPEEEEQYHEDQCKRCW